MRGTRLVIASCASGAAMASSKMALSAMLLVMGPEVSKVLDIGTIPVRLTRPMVGFSPQTAFWLEGDNMEPDVSEPKAATA